MGIKKKYAKGRLDKYYYMAKEQGLRARSAFKLVQLNKQFNFLEKAKCLVDLCAAPGGWLQIAQKTMPKPNIIIGLDLAPIKPIPGVITHVEDITTQKCRATLKKELKGWKADVFLHDGAPNVGTSWAQDAFTQSELVLASLRLAVDFLQKDGTFVTKVFRSKDYNKLIWVFNQLFVKVEATKPPSSRNVSAEIFVVCRGYKAPKNIDPRLLDPKYVFKEVDDEDDEEMDAKKKKEKRGQALKSILHPEKKHRQREGYEDGDYTLHLTRSISDFVREPEYLEILTRANEMKFDMDEFGKSLTYHPLTTSEIRKCCEDLKVLGRKDFKDLLKWRDAIRLDLGLDKKKEKKAEEEVPEETEEDVEKQVEEAAVAAAARAKREKRKSREKKAKQLIKLRLGMGTPSDIGLEAAEGGGLGLHDEEGLFRLDGTGRGKEMADKDIVLDLTSDEEEEDGEEEEGDDEDLYDSDQEVASKVGRLEADLDGLMSHLREQKMSKNPHAVVEKKKKAAAAFEEWYGVEYDKKKAEGSEDGSNASGGDSDSDSDSDSEDDVEMEDAERPTKVAGSKRKAAVIADGHGALEEDEDEDDEAVVDTSALSKRARVFFDNPLFNDAVKMTAGVKRKAGGSEKKAAEGGLFSQEMTSAGDDSSDDEADIAAMRRNQKKMKKAKAGKEEEEKEADNGFEVVTSQNLTGGEVQTDEYAITTATAYTLAQQMVRPSSRRDLLDGAYNRYAYNDGDLPSWFTDDESRHNKPTLPITKEAAAIIRERMKALDARPIKKVAEAKFRKQMRTQRRMEKMLKKTEAINNEDEESSEKSKLMSIAKLVKKAKNKKEEKKVQVVVAKGANRGNKGRPKGVKGRYKMVDPRMKKEIRAQKRIAKKNKKRK
ncbi:AdoMet-dependent rRNA methyltransferase spb1 [Rhizophlyctis rosea]|nr:AdoMet-dependent rRNA methyltransferase spb1 [Rhizophlyctis rosea]